jgi:hypothetical protein
MFIKVRVQSVIQNEIVYKTLFFNEHFIKSIVVDEDKNEKAKTVTILYDERGNNNLVNYEIHLLKRDDKILNEDFSQNEKNNKNEILTVHYNSKENEFDFLLRQLSDCYFYME